MTEARTSLIDGQNRPGSPPVRVVTIWSASTPGSVLGGVRAGRRGRRWSRGRRWRAGRRRRCRLRLVGNLVQQLEVEVGKLLDEVGALGVVDGDDVRQLAPLARCSARGGAARRRRRWPGRAVLGLGPAVVTQWLTRNSSPLVPPRFGPQSKALTAVPFERRLLDPPLVRRLVPVGAPPPPPSSAKTMTVVPASISSCSVGSGSPGFSVAMCSSSPASMNACAVSAGVVASWMSMMMTSSGCVSTKSLISSQHAGKRHRSQLAVVVAQVEAAVGVRCLGCSRRRGCWPDRRRRGRPARTTGWRALLLDPSTRSGSASRASATAMGRRSACRRAGRGCRCSTGRRSARSARRTASRGTAATTWSCASRRTSPGPAGGRRGSSDPLQPDGAESEASAADRDVVMTRPAVKPGEHEHHDTDGEHRSPPRAPGLLRRWRRAAAAGAARRCRDRSTTDPPRPPARSRRLRGSG